MAYSARPHPHVNIPQAPWQMPQPQVPRFDAPQQHDPPSPLTAATPRQPPWARQSSDPHLLTPEYNFSPQRTGRDRPLPQIPQQTNGQDYAARPMARPVSYTEGVTSADYSAGPQRESSASSDWTFPEPDLHRSVSNSSHHRPSPTHRSAHSDVGPALSRNISVTSTSSWGGDFTPTTEKEGDFTQLAAQLSNVTLQSEEGLRKFQAGELAPSDEEWHRLVPEAAIEALGKQEVQRQSVIFEVIKSEREYVSDLEAIQEVVIDPLRTANVIPADQLQAFLSEVFWNLHEILTYHQRMLAALFERQRDQHPLIQSITDIILETVLNFRPAYESYIKHYPLAEARHRRELKRNPAYQAFLSKSTADPRIRKRELITFISRPVTRLPRLSLLLETIQKHTDEDHPDMETMPLILGVLSDFIKSTQPGIESAENKVKFWGVAESLVYRTGEIIDMDLYDESRTLIHSGELARRQRSEIDWHGWNDYFVALMDNFLLITREETRPNGVVKRHVTSRPIPLDYLRLGDFNGPSENRKEKADDGGFLESLRFHVKPMYPFTVYHAAAKSGRRYTFYATSEAARTKWKRALTDAIGLWRAQREANLWFAPESLNDGFFRSRNNQVLSTSTTIFTGKVTTATAFMSGGRKFLAVGCNNGVWVCERGQSKFVRVLRVPSPSRIVALQDYNKLLVQSMDALHAYSLDLSARVALGASDPKVLNASLERIVSQDVLFFRAAMISGRMIVVYAAKAFRQTNVHALEALNLHRTHSVGQRDSASGHLGFRSFGDPCYVPRQAFDITALTKTIAIATSQNVTLVDPTNLSRAAVLVIPDFTGAAADAKAYDLKAKCDSAKALGIARFDASESLVVYEEFGCYVDRHGKPTRHSALLRWEAKAESYAHRGEHLLLFSSDFLEVRHLPTGRLVQVLQGQDLRVLHSDPAGDSPILMARRGTKDDSNGTSDQICELVETRELNSAVARPVVSGGPGLWDEWDM